MCCSKKHCVGFKISFTWFESGLKANVFIYGLLLVRSLVWQERKKAGSGIISISCKAQARSSYTHISNQWWRGQCSDTLIGQRREENERERHPHSQVTPSSSVWHVRSENELHTRSLNSGCACMWMDECFVWGTLTLDDVSQALCIQQVFEASHLLLQLTHQAVVGVLVDHGVAADLFGAISVPAGTEVDADT